MLTLSGILNLVDGILVFQNTNDAIILPTAEIPFTRVVAAGRQSHVIGNVSMLLGSLERYEFPVGSLTNYRKAVVEYPIGIFTPSPLTVRFIDQAPGGDNGFPITTFPGVFIDTTAEFSWLIKSAISQGFYSFNLEFYAEGWGLFQDVDSAANLLRVIRILDSPLGSTWTPQLGTYSNYVNSIPTPHPVVRIINTFGGIVREGSLFTFGLEKSGIKPSISGTVTYDNAANTPLSGVIVTLNPGGVTTTTDASGNYTFTDVAHGDYTVTASSTAAWAGANATDALLVSNYFNGISPITGLNLVAADVNASSTVNNTDALLIVRRFVGLDNSFARGDWVFTSADVTVNNDNVVADLEGLAVGDVNGSSTPATLPKQGAYTVSLSSNGTLQVNPTDPFEVSVKVSSTMNIGALSLRFNYPDEIVSFEGVSSKFSGTLYKSENGAITIAWADFTGKQAVNLKENDVLLVLKFKPTEKFEAGTKFSVELDDSYCELADSDGEIIKANLQASAIESFVPAEFGLRQNYPNPFNPSTTIEFDMPVAGNVSLIIYNILGEQVSVLVNEFQEAGTYKFNWVANKLPSGVYIYRLNVKAGNKNFTQNYRMILLK